jgi:hypothetical protein
MVGVFWGNKSRWFCRAKAIVGLRPSFSAHVRWGERGAPVASLTSSDPEEKQQVPPLRYGAVENLKIITLW